MEVNPTVAGRHQRNHHAAKPNWNVAPQRKSVGIKTKMLEHPRPSPPIACLPNSLKNWRASLLTGLWDSTAIGTISPCDDSPAYLTILLDAANPSERLRPDGSLDTGTPAEARNLAMTSLRWLCLTVLPGALLQTRLWRPNKSTSDPQRHWWGMQSFRVSRVPTATLTASSSSFKPHEVIGSASSQSPLWRDLAALNAARWSGVERPDSIDARSFSIPGRSQEDCFYYY